MVILPFKLRLPIGIAEPVCGDKTVIDEITVSRIVAGKIMHDNSNTYPPTYQVSIEDPLPKQYVFFEYDTKIWHTPDHLSGVGIPSLLDYFNETNKG